MSSDFRIDYVEAALIALLGEKLPAAYAANLPVGSSQIVAIDDMQVANVQVDSLGDDDFDDEGRLVLQPPAVRVRFINAPYDPLKDNQRLTYQTSMAFQLLCFESSLRGSADERKQTLILVATVAEQLAGARLALSDSETTMPITVKRVGLAATDGGPVDQLFEVNIEIEGIAQFDGVNARPGS